MKANLNRTIKQKDASQIRNLHASGSSVDDIAATLDINVDCVATFVDGLSTAEAPKAPKAPAKKKTATKKKTARTKTPE
jgi:hypothetical protein